MHGLNHAAPADRPSVLVVEDDDDIRDSFRDALEDEGYSVVTARNGHEALRTLRDGTTPCAIVLDLMMPGMNGWQFRSEQRREPQLAGIPVVVVTASMTNEAAARDLADLNVHRCLRKPVALEELLGVLAPLCDAA